MDASSRPVGKSIEREILWREFKRNKKAFFEAAWKIKRVGAPPTIISLYEAQHEVIDWYDADGGRNYVSLKARQIGWTTITSAYAFYTTWFAEWKPWLFISQNEDYAKKNLGMVKFGWANLPKWIKERPGVPQILTNTTEVMEWDNGGRIESIPATGSAGRGDAVYGCMWDETAHAPDPDNQYAAIDPLVYGKFILLSSANGAGNFFANTYQDAKKPGSEWQHKFLPWDAREDRDEEWYEKKAREKRATPWVMHQEYPRNDQEAFVRSGKTPIGFDLIEEFEWEDADVYYSFEADEFTRIEPEEAEEHAVAMAVWEEPSVERNVDGVVIRPPNYVVSADLAEGIEGGDYTVIVVVNANTGATAARIHTALPVENAADLIAAVGHRYHTALVGVERNNHGWGVLNWLDNVNRYPRLYRQAPVATTNRTRTQTLGWRTTPATKPKMVRDYARAMRDHSIEPLDPMLKLELLTFVQDDKGLYGASAGNHDDVVIAHMIAHQLAQDVHRFPILWVDPKPNYTTMAQFDEIAESGPVRREGSSNIGDGQSRKVGEVRRSFMVVPKR